MQLGSGEHFGHRRVLVFIAAGFLLFTSCSAMATEAVTLASMVASFLISWNPAMVGELFALGRVADGGLAPADRPQ